MTDVCLVQVPYAALERPSIALGTLDAVLRTAGVESEVLYPNFWMAEDIGLTAYVAVSNTPAHSMVAEWTFAGAVFPDRPPDISVLGTAEDPVLARLAYVLNLGRPPSGFDACGVLAEIRAGTEAYLDRVAARVLAAGPLIVGCSSTFQQHCASLALLRRIRERTPHVVTLLGGANCEGPMGLATLRAFPWVDYVVSGEADGLIVDLCRRIFDAPDHRPTRGLPIGVFGPPHRVHGTDASEPDVTAAQRATVSDLDSLPLPNYDSYFEELRRSPLAAYVRPGLLVETARGCWWGEKHPCTFCGLNGGGIRYRSKSPRRAVEELDSLYARYRIPSFEVVDNIADTRYFDTVLAELARRKAPYSLFYETKANLGEKELERLAQAGVRYVQPGIESLHSAVLGRLNKGATVWGNLSLLKKAVEHGIRLDWLFLFGLPGESDEWYEEMAQWLPWVVHLHPPAGAARIEYHRFSDYHRRPGRHGIRLSPHERYFGIYPIEAELVSDMAYIFEDYGESERGHVSEDRPGLWRWHRIVTDWRVSWMKERGSSPVPSPRVVFEKRGDATVIVDTRPGATERAFVTDATQRAVLQACDRGVRADRVVSLLDGGDTPSVPREAVLAAVDELRRRHLLLDIEGRLLSVVNARGPRLTTEGFPGGHVALERYRRDLVAAGEAVDGARVPGLTTCPSPRERVCEVTL